MRLQPGARLHGAQTSRGVERKRCATCLAPVRGAAPPRRPPRPGPLPLM